MAVAEKLNPVRLDWSEKDRKVIVAPKDNDKYMRTVEEAIEACKAYDNKIRFWEQFKIVLDDLGKWSKDRTQKLDHAFLTVQDAGLLFLVVTKRKTYDDMLESELTDLDLKIANDSDFTSISLSVQSLPSCSMDGISSFLNPEYTLELQLGAKR